jgi:two-component system, response regulator
MIEKYVLLIEDNPDDVELTQIAFKKCRIPNELIVVEDGQEALNFIFERCQYVDRYPAELPAVILLDLKLPFISGQEILKQIRLNTRTCRIPVVVLSSTTNMQEIEECEQLGINRYYRKPDNFPAFKKIIEDIRDSFLEKDRNQTQNGYQPKSIILPNTNPNGKSRF